MRKRTFSPSVDRCEDKCLMSVAWPTHVSAPYVDITTADPNYVKVDQLYLHTGVNHFTLGFITASSTGAPVWGNDANTLTSSLFGTQLQASLATLRSVPYTQGDVSASFGGAAGTELADYPGMTLANLKAAYQSVITTYGVTHIDFDIEGTALTNVTANTMRSQAIAALEVANPGLQVSVTLPCGLSGYTADGINLLKNMQANSAAFATVNAMAFDFGLGAGVDYGTQAITAGTAAATQVAGLTGNHTSTGAPNAAGWQQAGIIDMIITDDGGEVWTIADQTALRTFGESVGMGEISMWSTNRDSGVNYVPGYGNTNYAYDFIDRFYY